jgi:beta-glucosidase-like glycosyl hydrolase
LNQFQQILTINLCTSSIFGLSKVYCLRIRSHIAMLICPQDAVHAGTGNIMCSYNRLNNSHGCANSKTLNGLLKTELGFNGFVVSDWFAQHSGVSSALAGLDMAMPGMF